MLPNGLRRANLPAIGMERLYGAQMTVRLRDCHAKFMETSRKGCRRGRMRNLEDTPRLTENQSQQVVTRWDKRVQVSAGPTSNSLAVYYKVAIASEPASYTWGVAGASFTVGGVQAFTGVDTTTPIDAENGRITPSATTHATPSITTTMANTMVVPSHAFASARTCEEWGQFELTRLFRTLLNVDNTLGGVGWERKGPRSILGGNGNGSTRSSSLRRQERERCHPLAGSSKEATASQGARERAGLSSRTASQSLMPTHPGLRLSGVGLV